MNSIFFEKVLKLDEFSKSDLTDISQKRFLIIVEGGKLNQNYDEKLTAIYMKSENIEINIENFTG